MNSLLDIRISEENVNREIGDNETAYESESLKCPKYAALYRYFRRALQINGGK